MRTPVDALRLRSGVRPAARVARAHPALTALMVLTLAMALVAGLTPLAQARPAPAGFADLAEKVLPAVVNVSVEKKADNMVMMEEGGNMPFPPGSPFDKFFRRFYDRDMPGPGMPNQGAPENPPIVRGVGSGFIIDADGYVVTNNHVIDGSDRIEVTLADGDQYPARLIGRDEKTDLALLKIDAGRSLSFVRFGDSDAIRVGDWVLAVGNPFGLGGTVTAGIVSARGRDLVGGNIADFLQIDAPINRGNSGGPSFNTEGEVIGVNTAIVSPNGGSVGIGFAVPSTLVKQVVTELRENGHIERGWLGVSIQTITPDIAESLGLDKPRGALIAAVEPASPAAKAGLKAGDVVLGWNGKTVDKVSDLPRLVANASAGDKAKVTVWRGKAEQSLEIVVGKAPAEQAQASGEGEPGKNGAHAVPGAGLALADLTPALRQRFGIGDEVTGVLVARVEPSGAAARQGLQPGDVIRSVALEPVSSAGEAARKFEEQRKAGAKVVALAVWRQGAERFVALRTGVA